MHSGAVPKLRLADALQLDHHAHRGDRHAPVIDQQHALHQPLSSARCPPQETTRLLDNYPVRVAVLPPLYGSPTSKHGSAAAVDSYSSASSSVTAGLVCQCRVEHERKAPPVGVARVQGSTDWQSDILCVCDLAVNGLSSHRVLGGSAAAAPAYPAQSSQRRVPASAHAMSYRRAQESSRAAYDRYAGELQRMRRGYSPARTRQAVPVYDTHPDQQRASRAAPLSIEQHQQQLDQLILEASDQLTRQFVDRALTQRRDQQQQLYHHQQHQQQQLFNAPPDSYRSQSEHTSSSVDRSSPRITLSPRSHKMQQLQQTAQRYQTMFERLLERTRQWHRECEEQATLQAVQQQAQHRRDRELRLATLRLEHMRHVRTMMRLPLIEQTALLKSLITAREQQLAVMNASVAVSDGVPSTQPA